MACHATASLAFAHGDEDKGSKRMMQDDGGHKPMMQDDGGHKPMMHDDDELAIGKPGDAARGIRKIEVDMNDAFRFSPATLKFPAGETVRLVIHNSGAVLHEWILGTSEDIEEHAELMRRSPSMEHDEPQQVRVPPGEMRELVWEFDRAGTLMFAGLQPGHFEAGMKGLVEVK